MSRHARKRRLKNVAAFRKFMKHTNVRAVMTSYREQIEKLFADAHKAYSRKIPYDTAAASEIERLIVMHAKPEISHIVIKSVIELDRE